MRRGVHLQTEVPQAVHRERRTTAADPRSKCEPTTRQLAFIEEMKTVLGFGLADFDRWLGRFGVDRVTALDRDSARKVIAGLLAIQRRHDPRRRSSARLTYVRCVPLGSQVRRTVHVTRAKEKMLAIADHRGTLLSRLRLRKSVLGHDHTREVTGSSPVSPIHFTLAPGQIVEFAVELTSSGPGAESIHRHGTPTEHGTR